MNISSVVVKCAPQFLESVVSSIESLKCCEIHAKDELCRIVIVLDGETTEEESNKLRDIQALDHVLSAEMVYAYSDSEFAAEEGKFEKVSSEILDRLNSDLPAEEIVYNVHLKDK
jgi:nitrate reductase NapD